MKKEKISSGKLYKIFVYVALITLAISIIVPVVWVFMSSLKTNAEFQGSPWSLPASFYIQNFLDAFEKANMAEYFLNSVIVTALGLLLLVIIALPASYVLARFDFKGKKFINTAFMGGLFINVNYIVVPIFLMLTSWDDVVYDMIGDFFFLDNIVVLAVVYAATAIPFTVYLLSSYFRTLPKAYEEAAFIDGCTRWQTYWKIVFPLLKPTIATVAIIDAMAFWNDYLLPSLVLGRKELYTLPIATQAFYGTYSTDLGLVMAALLLAMLPILVLYLFLQRYIVEGVTSGAVKG